MKDFLRILAGFAVSRKSLIALAFGFASKPIAFLNLKIAKFLSKASISFKVLGTSFWLIDKYSFPGLLPL